jgi:uncharacterized glyoxalase superfamily protein PhnB
MVTNRSAPPATVIPVLSYEDVGAASDWICNVFGFKERLRIGTHRAQLVFGDGALIVNERQQAGPPESAASPKDELGHSVHIHVEDVDLHYEHARQAGAHILSAPESFPFGERQYSALDLGGHTWTFSQSIADIDPASFGATIGNLD